MHCCTDGHVDRAAAAAVHPTAEQPLLHLSHVIGIQQIPVHEAAKEAGKFGGVGDDPAVCTLAVVLGGLVGADPPIDRS